MIDHSHRNIPLEQEASSQGHDFPTLDASCVRKSHRISEVAESLLSLQKSLVNELISDRKIEELRETVRGHLGRFADRPKVRIVAAKLLIELSDSWCLTARESRSLIGISEGEQEAWISGGVVGLDVEKLEKIACLLGIYKDLFTLYSGHQDRVDRWMSRRNHGDIFYGGTPYELLVGASPNMFQLARQRIAAEAV